MHIFTEINYLVKQLTLCIFYSLYRISVNLVVQVCDVRVERCSSVNLTLSLEDHASISAFKAVDFELDLPDLPDAISKI